VPVLAQTPDHVPETLAAPVPETPLVRVPETPILAQDVPESWEPLDDVPEAWLEDVPVLAQARDTTGWRIERFGPKGADGKGRYWQWRTGSGDNRRSAYGGKVKESAG